MEITIEGYPLTKYNEVEINLRYDDIADSFSFSFYFDPHNKTHRQLFMPGKYPTCTITHRGVLVMTGTVLSYTFKSAGDPPKQLVYISGYSLCGVIGDCTLLNTDAPATADGTPIKSTPSTLQGLTIAALATRLCKTYEDVFKVKVDKEVEDDANSQPLPNIEIAMDETIATYLNKVCTNKNIVLSHDAEGNLLLTRGHTNSLLTGPATAVKYQPVPISNDIPGAPSFTQYYTKQVKRAILFDFTYDPKDTTIKPWLSMGLTFDGQKLHSLIQVVGQKTNVNSTDGLSQPNPYLIVNANSKGDSNAAFRYQRRIQTTGDDNQTVDTARSYVGDELKAAIIVPIKIEGWVLNGNLVTPNQLVTITNPEIYLYKKSTFFIQAVTLRGNEKEETAEITCVLPAAFDDSDLVNIFTDTK